ncbi:laccase, multicopper oxidase, benzenediol:oxygen oxidorectuctase [Marasmius tenuissimus]|nr:laccase, multicopper oxidase, benzenediol:oxygen oxidorectuctase [Marasmius tenuissimus]
MISFRFLLSRLLLVGVLATSASASAAPNTLKVDMHLPLYPPPLRSQGELRIVNAELSPDGFSRIGVLADGQFPGPLITATKGEVLDITVYDKLVDNSFYKSTSIHWHGLRQQGVAWADGPTQVTQCPISPGHSFRYRVRTDDLTGTYWYHSHIRGQYCDGLRGALVIYDPEDPHACLYDVDDESTVITLADWYV